jgi:glycosyltransferase involved in cell wall biosynthesis
MDGDPAAVSGRPVVLLVTGSLGQGGTELTVFRTALGLLGRARFQPAVAVLGDGGPLAQELRDAGIRVHELGIRGRLYGPAGLLGVARLRRVVRIARASIVHTFLFDADFLGSVAARLGGARVITTRRAIKRGRAAQLVAYRWTNRLATRIVANSDEVQRFTLLSERAPEAKVLVIPNGIDVACLASGDGRSFRTRLGIPLEATVIGAVGTVKPVKGQDVLFEAVLPLLHDRPGLFVLVAGSADTALGASLRARATQDEVSDRFRLLGAREDVADFLAAVDVFVLPSRSEGMSNALLEAMAAGRSIVATRVGGNAQALAGGQAGRIVPPDDPRALREAVAALLEDPTERTRLGRLASTRAREEYDLPIMLERTERLYRQVLEGG